MHPFLPDHRNVVFFGYARTALEYGFRYLGLQAGDEILYPAYICDVTMVPCNNLGIRVKFYEISDDLTVDFSNIRKTLTQKTRALLAVNYFGFPQPAAEIRNFCREHGLYFIEDSAHSFLSIINGLAAGSHGDISILSFRKMIPMVNGAALVVNHQPADEERIAFIQKCAASLPPEISTMKRLKSLLHRLEDKYSIPFTKLRKAQSGFLPPGHAERENLPYRIDSQSLSILEGINYEKVVRRRRRKYARWIESLVPKGFTPIHGYLEDGIVPWACPLYTNHRDEWLTLFMKARVRVTTWPTLPEWVGLHCKNAVALWQKLVVFPL